MCFLKILCVKLNYIFFIIFLVCYFCLVEGTVILQSSLMQMDSRSLESTRLVSLMNSLADINGISRSYIPTNVKMLLPVILYFLSATFFMK